MKLFLARCHRDLLLFRPSQSLPSIKEKGPTRRQQGQGKTSRPRKVSIVPHTSRHERRQQWNRHYRRDFCIDYLVESRSQFFRHWRHSFGFACKVSFVERNCSLCESSNMTVLQYEAIQPRKDLLDGNIDKPPQIPEKDIVTQKSTSCK